MGTATFVLSKELVPKVDAIVREFGFESKEEFFEEAVKDKVLELQKKLFISGSDKISEQLKKKKISEIEILTEFNRKVHSR